MMPSTDLWIAKSPFHNNMNEEHTKSSAVMEMGTHNELCCNSNLPATNKGKAQAHHEVCNTIDMRKLFCLVHIVELAVWNVDIVACNKFLKRTT